MSDDFELLCPGHHSHHSPDLCADDDCELLVITVITCQTCVRVMTVSYYVLVITVITCQTCVRGWAGPGGQGLHAAGKSLCRDRLRQLSVRRGARAGLPPGITFQGGESDYYKPWMVI